MPGDETIRTYDRTAAAFLERHRDRSQTRESLVRFAARLPKGATVIDVGCGPGFDAADLRAHGLRAIGMDLSRGMLDVARREFPGALVRGDLRRLPFRAVHALWVNASLLHLPHADASAALAGFRDALRPGGLLFLAMKEGEGERWEESPDAPHAPRFFAYWRAASLDAALHAAGFGVLEGTARGSWLLRTARR